MFVRRGSEADKRDLGDAEDREGIAVDTRRHSPREHLDLVETTFSRIAGPLTRLLPDLAPNEIALLSRTLFSAVHGVIALGLEERIVAVPVKDLRRQVGLFVDACEAGLGAYGAY